MEICPCGSGLAFSTCCKLYIRGGKPAPSAEALMRSRYSAYVSGDIDYIIETCLPEGRETIDREQTRRWSEESQWKGLQIVDKIAGGPDDTEGTVEFIATYITRGLKDSHRERALFKKEDGRWFYDTGTVIPTTISREGPKQRRNEPCACGSGEKFKRCCGR